MFEKAVLLGASQGGALLLASRKEQGLGQYFYMSEKQAIFRT